MRIIFYFIGFLLFLLQSASALTIKIDYTYDTNNFFNTTERRAAIEAVAKFFGDAIQDNLLEIDNAQFNQATWSADFIHPETGLTESISNLIVPEDTVIVYVGARNLGESILGRAGPGGFSAGGFPPWFARIRGRGQTDAESDTASLRTDYSLWGGSIAFDVDTTWNFSLTDNNAGFEFVSVALHEMGHVLGVGTADSWNNLVNGSGLFTGSNVFNSLGFNPEAATGHFGNVNIALNSSHYGSFGASHGILRPALMLPVLSDTGNNYDVFTDADLAALVDIGWEIFFDPSVTNNSLSPTSSSFTWPSTSFLFYEIQRSDDLSNFTLGGSGQLNGLAGNQTWSDPSPLPDRAFYRLKASNSLTTNPLLFSPLATNQSTLSSDIQENSVYSSITVAPRVVDNCYGNCEDGHE